jgi:hypothetical protein
MARLEDLNPGAWVSILPDALVNVMDVKWHHPSWVDLGEPYLAAAPVARRPTILRGVRR